MEDDGLIIMFLAWVFGTVAGRITGALLLVLGIFIGWNFEYGTEHNVTFTVNALDDQGGYKGHKYLVFTTREDGQTEVFKNTDSFWHGKYDSSDVWARFIEAGKGATWTCPVYGFRIFFSSSYRDILDGCTLVTKPGQQQTSVTSTGHDPLSLAGVSYQLHAGLAD